MGRPSKERQAELRNLPTCAVGDDEIKMLREALAEAFNLLRKARSHRGISNIMVEAFLTKYGVR